MASYNFVLWDLAETPQKKSAGLAIFYCGCNQSKSLHICGGKDKHKNGNRKVEKRKT